MTVPLDAVPLKVKTGGFRVAEIASSLRSVPLRKALRFYSGGEVPNAYGVIRSPARRFDT